MTRVKKGEHYSAEVLRLFGWESLAKLANGVIYTRKNKMLLWNPENCEVLRIYSEDEKYMSW